MSWANAAIGQLQKGEQANVTPHGNSMTPRVVSGQTVTLAPLKAGEPKKGDVVLAKVNGRVYLHKVTAVKGSRVQISNNHGHVNGWTALTNVYGRALI